MKRKWIIFATFLLSINSISGQTIADFEKKYGSGTYYEIRPKILMSAEFDKNGQVCRVSLQPNRISKKTNTAYLGQTSLDLVELKKAFDELVPSDQRIGELNNDGGYFMSGGMYWGALNYENISIGVQGAWRTKAPQTNDFCQIFGRETSDTKPKAKFSFCSMYGSLDVVTIRWTKRICVEN